jgi:hypothetical protein
MSERKPAPVRYAGGRLRAAFMGAVLVATMGIASPVAAANGDNLASFDAVATAGIPACATGIGVGVAYDVTTDSLVLSCYLSNVLERVDAVTHLNDGALTIAGLPGGNSLGALAYDAGRNRLWACNSNNVSFNIVVLIDLTTSAVDPSVTPFPVAGCFDGLAYDGSDDTLWVSPDVSGTVYHYTIAGALIASFPVTVGGCGNSGIAVGGSLLYLANNGCSQIYSSPKDFSVAPTLFATFPARLEDLECDSETFSGLGVGAIWSIDAFDRKLNAWEIPAGACASGGGGGTTLTALSDAHLWLGLKNSDDQGTQFDVKVELFRNAEATPLASGLTRCVTNLTRNPTFAKDVAVAWDPFSPVSLASGDVLKIVISTRIGTTLTGAKCPGPGGSHNNARALRLYYDSVSRDSHFDMTVNTVNSNQYLHSDGGLCDKPAATVESQNVLNRTFDSTPPSATAARCKDSGNINFAGGNLFSQVGTWTKP